MFDIGWSEMAIIMLLALIIIGPKDLPRVARTIGQWVRKGRMLAREFQTSLEDMAKEAELDDVKKEIEKVGKTDLKKTFENSIDPKGELKSAFDTSKSATGEDTVGKTLNGSGGAKTDEAVKTEAISAPAKAASPKSASEAKTSKPAAAKKTTPKRAAASKKPSSKPTTTAGKTSTATKTTPAKKPAARKRSAKPASSGKSGSDAPPSDKTSGSSAMAAKSS